MLVAPPVFALTHKLCAGALMPEKICPQCGGPGPFGIVKKKGQKPYTYKVCTTCRNRNYYNNTPTRSFIVTRTVMCSKCDHTDDDSGIDNPENKFPGDSVRYFKNLGWKWANRKWVCPSCSGHLFTGANLPATPEQPPPETESVDKRQLTATVDAIVLDVAKSNGLEENEARTLVGIALRKNKAAFIAAVVVPQLGPVGG